MAAALLWAAMYFVVINGLAYLAMAEDKARAEARVGDRRIPEYRLLQMALLGGSVGALLAQQMLRHKTRKQPFATQLRLIAVFHAVLLLGFAFALVKAAS